VLNLGAELVAIHAESGAPYPVELFVDVDGEAWAAVVARRILALGGTPAEVRRLLQALGLGDHQRAKLELTWRSRPCSTRP
jgi:hypothetical protein